MRHSTGGLTEEAKKEAWLSVALCCPPTTSSPHPQLLPPHQPLQKPLSQESRRDAVLEAGPAARPGRFPFPLPLLFAAAGERVKDRVEPIRMTLRIGLVREEGPEVPLGVPGDVGRDVVFEVLCGTAGTRGEVGVET